MRLLLIGLVLIPALLRAQPGLQWRQTGPSEDTKAVAYSPFFGQVMGKVVSLLVDRVGDPSGRTIYAGTESSGLWKTSDFGKTWKNVTDNIPLSCGVYDIASDPRIPGVIYIATGMNSAAIAEYGRGVWKTVNGGSSWRRIYGDVNDFSIIFKIITDPRDGRMIYCCTNDKVLRSPDAGHSWEVIFGEGDFSLTQDYPYLKKRLNDIAIMPGSNTVYVSSTGFQDYTQWKWHTAEIWKTKNAKAGRVKWKRIDPPMISKRYELAISALHPEALWVAGADSSKKVKIFKSEDGGSGWRMRFDARLYLADENRLELEVSPTDTTTVYVGGGYAFRMHPEPVIYKHEAITTGHVDTRAMLLLNGSPPGSTGISDSVFIGNDGGVSFCPAGGRNKEVISLNGKDLIISQFYGIGGSENNPEAICGGTLDNGLFTLTDEVWTQSPGGGDAGDVLIDPDDPAVMYSNVWGSANFNYGIKFTRDGWKTSSTWSGKTFKSQPSYFNRPLSFHPGRPDTIYAAFHDVFRTTNASEGKRAVWTAFSSFTEEHEVGKGQILSAMTIVPQEGKIVYAAFYEPDWNRNAQMKKFFKTDDQYQEKPVWENISNNPGLDVLHYSYITDIVVNPDKSQEVWISMSGISGNGRVLMSADGGKSWRNFSKGLPVFPVHCIRFKKGKAGGLYAGTDEGIFYADPAGFDRSGWVSVNGNMPPAVIQDIEINEKSGIIRVGTFGRGIWECRIP